MSTTTVLPPRTQPAAALAVRKSKINVGLVGVGRMGIAYARYLSARVPGPTLYAVSDVRAEAAEATRAECNASKAYADYRDLLGDKNVDAVVVMTPTKFHKDVVIDAARAGKAIFCEKPLSLSLEDAAAMKAAVDQTGVFFQLS